MTYLQPAQPKMSTTPSFQFKVIAEYSDDQADIVGVYQLYDHESICPHCVHSEHVDGDIHKCNCPLPKLPVWVTSVLTGGYVQGSWAGFSACTLYKPK